MLGVFILLAVLAKNDSLGERSNVKSARYLKKTRQQGDSSPKSERTSKVATTTSHTKNVRSLPHRARWSASGT
jgi:hypothetical protein